MDYLTSEIPVWAVLVVAGVQAVVTGLAAMWAGYRGWQATDARGERLLSLRRR